MNKIKPQNKIDLDLDLPDGRHFISLPPVVPFEEMCALNLQYALEEMKKPDFWERRKLRTPVDAEFVL